MSPKRPLGEADAVGKPGTGQDGAEAAAIAQGRRGPPIYSLNIALSPLWAISIDSTATLPLVAFRSGPCHFTG